MLEIKEIIIVLFIQGAGVSLCQEPDHVGHQAWAEANLDRGASTGLQLRLQFWRDEVKTHQHRKR